MRYHEILLDGRPIDTPEFQTWFAGSKVNKRGKPMMMFHGTNAVFTEFHPGSHFGTVRAANHRLMNRRIWGEDSLHIKPVYLAIKNPLRVIEDLHAGDEAALLNAICRGSYPDLDVHVARKLGAYVAAEQAGYDGLVYRNDIEDRGKLSWVVFHPSQVRSALTDTLGPLAKALNTR